MSEVLKTALEKMLKTSRGVKIVSEKKTAKFHPRKKIRNPRKKYQISPLKIQKVPENSEISTREKQNSTREKF